MEKVNKEKIENKKEESTPISEIPKELAYAINSLESNNDASRFILWLNRNKRPEINFEIKNTYLKRQLKHIIYFEMENIKYRLDYEKAFQIWRILKDSGVLDKTFFEIRLRNI